MNIKFIKQIDASLKCQRCLRKKPCFLTLKVNNGIVSSRLCKTCLLSVSMNKLNCKVENIRNCHVCNRHEEGSPLYGFHYCRSCSIQLFEHIADYLER